MLFGGAGTYIWKFRVSFPVGQESVGAQIVFKAPAKDMRRKKIHTAVQKAFKTNR